MRTVFAALCAVLVPLLMASCATTGTVAPDADAAAAESAVSTREQAMAYLAFSLAQQASFGGQTGAALSWVDRAVALDPRSAYLQTFRASLLVKGGDTEAAANALDAALAAQPDYLPALYLRGGLMVALGREDEAIASYEKALLSGADEEELYSNLIDLYLRREDLGRASRLVQRMRRRYPDSAAGLVREGKVLWLRGKADAARASLVRAIATDPDNDEAMLLLGMIHEAEGETEDAINLYENAVRRAPHNFRLRAHLLSLYLQEDRFDDATRQNDVLEMMGADDAAVARTRGTIALGRDKLPEAERFFADAVAADPADELSRYYLGTTRLRLEKFDAALEAFEPLRESEDWAAEGNYGVAYVYRERGRFEEALALLERAVELEPESREFRRMLALALADTGDYGRAERVLKDVIAEAPDNESYRFSLAAVYEKSEEYDKGVRVMQKVLDEEPDNAEAHNYIGYTYAVMEKHLDEAERHLDKAIALKPGDPYITDSIAWLHFKQGRYESALRLLEDAVDKLPDEAVLHQHLGEVLLALGEEDRAVVHLEKALDLAKDRKLKKQIQDRLDELR